jgi:hypothetical protein
MVPTSTSASLRHWTTISSEFKRKECEAPTLLEDPFLQSINPNVSYIRPRSSSFENNPPSVRLSIFSSFSLWTATTRSTKSKYPICLFCILEGYVFDLSWQDQCPTNCIFFLAAVFIPISFWHNVRSASASSLQSHTHLK